MQFIELEDKLEIKGLYMFFIRKKTSISYSWAKCMISGN